MVRFCFFCWKVSFLPCVPEVLCGLTIVFARLLGLHADSDWTCQRYTFMLVMMFCNGILSKIGWTTSWRCPVWFLLLPFSYYYPLFPPKKKSDAEKADIVRAELEQFLAEHGQMPSQHADLPSSRSLYAKLKKLKLLHLLKHDWRRGVCDDTLKFYDLHGRIPRRQNMSTDEQRAEDALARRWDRLLEQKASLPDELLNEYQRIFVAADVEVDDGHLAVCVAVSEFLDRTRRLPKRQVGDSAEKQAEDALAQRWDRLMAEKASVSEELLSSYNAIFGAAEMEVDDGHLAICVAVSDFFETTHRLPKRQVGDSDEKRAEDALARRWDRFMAEKASVSEDLLSSYNAIFGAAEMEVDDGHLAICVAVSEFFDTTHRLPKRQVGDSDEKRAEDALARRWDRLMAEKASVSEELLSSYNAIFGAAEMEVDDGRLAICVAVSEFFDTTHRLPKRQVGDSAEKQAEDALARRWDRLMAEKASVSEDLLSSYSAIFGAAEMEVDDAPRAACIAVHDFFLEAQRLPRRFDSITDANRAEDVLARRWHRLVACPPAANSELMGQFAEIFTANGEAWNAAVESGLATFLDEVSVVELFHRCVALQEDAVQRYSGSAVQEFRAACVAWVLKQYGVGCQELEGLSLDGLDDLDDTRAFRAELQSYVARTGSLPPAVGAGRSAEEKRLHAGLVQVRKRRFAAVRRDRAGRIIDYAAALQETQLVAWEAVPEFGPFLWNPRHAAVFNAVQQCLLDTGELPARGPKSPTDALAQQVRRIRQKTLLPGNQRMRSAEQQYWEKHFPQIWSTRQMKDYYIPGGQLQNADSRRVFYRTPLSAGMLACELCGFNCDNQLDFVKHLRDEHLPAPADAAAHELGRCEEEYRKRMVFHEEQSGPFPVPGEQIRRGVGCYAFHQTHSRKAHEARERKLESCVICARSCWLEDMERLKLFVDAEKAAVEEPGGDGPGVEADDDSDSDDGEKKHGWQVHEVSKQKVHWLHRKVFDVRRYEKLWPSIPKEELLGSCVSHPSGTYEDGVPWKWLLNTKVLPEKVTSATVSFACSDCVRAVTGKQPRMPKYALANSLWIGRYPNVFKHQGKPLSPMTFLLLSLGRTVVQKIIAEPHKTRPVKEKQKGIRANTIAFPQAQLHELATAHLPPLPAEAQRFLSQTISIALVGCTPEAGTCVLIFCVCGE